TGLRVGTEITGVYLTQDNRNIVNTVTVGPAATVEPVTPPPAEGTVLQGSVVRVVGQDQVVIRTSDGKEVIVYVTPQTTYNFNDAPATFSAIQPGVPIRVDYELRDRRPYARGIFGVRRR